MNIINENKLIWYLNKLYWFKDSFNDENQTYYLENLLKVAENLECDGLVKEIKDYLLIQKV